MQSRRKVLKKGARWLAAIACLPVLALSGQASQAQVPRGPVLKQRLLVGLRVKTKSDRQFITRIVELVERRILPVKLVDTTYFWARAKAAKSRTLSNNPMVYFRPGMVVRAAKLGIRL